MRYKVGDEVVLNDNTETMSAGDMVSISDIERYWTGQKVYVHHGDFRFRFDDDMIDHEKTATLNRENYAKYMEKQINDPAYQELLKELSEPVVDTVDHPPHYTQGKIEVIDIIEVLTEGYTGYQGYLVGNVVKYIARANFKGNKEEDIKKGQFYFNRLVKEVEEDAD